MQKVYYGTSSQAQHTHVADDEDINIHDQSSLKDLTKQLYKQNLDLAVVNKTLNVIQSLYAVTLVSLNLKEVAQKLVDTIVRELNFTAVLISLIDEEKKTLNPVAITQSAEVIKALEYIGRPLEEISIATDDSQNLAIHVINERKRQITGNLLDILTPHVVQEEADHVEQITNIKTLIIYPLLLGEKCLGVLNIALAKKQDDLSRVEKETIEQLLNVVSISLDRAQLYENLKIANKKLQELDKLKDEFVSLASHELRTPMAAIKGSLSTILDGYAGEVSNEAKEFLTAAYSENDRLIRLVNNLLNISRIESGRFTFTITQFDVGNLIKEVVSNLEMSATEKKIYLKHEEAEHLPKVSADEDKVREVLINLIGNAVKFTHQGGITVKAAQKDASILVSVSDTGSGIAKEDQDLLFKKFSQVQGSYAKQTGGTGLGLYISKQIVEGLKGNIWLESTIGKGSTFFFSLPIAK